MLYRLFLSWRRLSAAQMHQNGEAKSRLSLIAVSQAATWSGLNRVNRKSHCRSDDHVWKNLSNSASINAAVSSLTVFQLPKPVLQFLDQILPKAGVPATDGCTSLRGASPTRRNQAITRCCRLQAVGTWRNPGQPDPVAFDNFIPTLLTCAACVSSWDASQLSNDMYLLSLKDSQRNPFWDFTHR